MPGIVRTPNDLLVHLPDFPFKPKYRKYGDLRLAHIDEGKGPPVVFIHGEPTWSFLWRKMIPPIRDAGYRCIAPDLPGFGRSDKPIDIEWYTYDRHTEVLARLFDELKLHDATIVVHDWGGPIGLRVAVERPNLVGRMVILDSGLFTGHQKMTESWMAFRELAKRSEDLPVSFLIRAGCRIPPAANVVAAYEAPFPNPPSKAGARAFPLILPTTPQMNGAATGQRVLSALGSDPRPKLIIWGEGDAILPLEAGWRFARAIGAEVDHVVKGVGHYLQEDAGHQVGRMIVRWLKAYVSPRQAMTDAIRTPEEVLTELPDFPFEPRYRDFEGIRLAHLDVGDGPPVVFMHGEPTWSFLWRRVIPAVRDAGYRCIAPDLPGFGRSDKPIDIGWYTYDRHTASVAALVEELDLRDATIVVHDWGGPIGLRVAVERPDRFARMVVLDTGLFTGHQPMNDAWMAFRDFVERTEDLPVSLLVRRACLNDPGDEVIAAYDAPFPTAAAKAGARAFPLILPLTPDAPGAPAGQRVLDALRGDTRPKLFLWADSDPVLPLETGRRFAAALGAEIDHVIAGASHFLQEDAGPEIGRLIADWLRSGRG